MNRLLLTLALSAFAAPALSMTATVAATTPQSAAPGAAAKAGAPTSTTVKGGALPAAAAAKSTAPSAASVIRPSAVLSAPGVPMKSAGTVATKPSAGKPGGILPASTPQAANATPAATSASWNAVSASNSSMRSGTLQAINVGTGTFQVYGQKLNFNSQRVKVFGRDGKLVSVFGLKSGANVRFTLDPTDSRHRRVAVIYVN